ncbi:MAG: SpoIID/LytB domain-containing protein [Bacteroidaceae bacterium]|nr:SpoIID/LytB domain-containing protein [Bacteroidaceae bacterium]
MTKFIVNVGIQNGNSINITFHSSFICGKEIVGNQEFSLKDNAILWNEELYKQLTFIPSNPEANFSLEEVTIGKKFHWQRNERQTFRGQLRLIVHDQQIYAINSLPIEDYLESVVSSEMSAEAPLEFLKAHSIISRSWVISMIEKRKKKYTKSDTAQECSHNHDTGTYIKWYDHEEHSLFDVCADDHCQRYQGITRITNEKAKTAVRATQGLILSYNGNICDTRFSKCCGGITEEYASCWENTNVPYLKSFYDSQNNKSSLPDLSDEEQARAWILSTPNSYCNTKDNRIIAQIMNNYDIEDIDFYRWKVNLSQKEITKLINEKSKLNIGSIKELNPIERGKSGRIIRLQIVGTLRTVIIGKELEIRRLLSHSHLRSSAFCVETIYSDTDKNLPSHFILHGAGWGHGVGLCQIGAAVMATKGMDYKEILHHYYPGTSIQHLSEIINQNNIINKQ